MVRDVNRIQNTIQGAAQSPSCSPLPSAQLPPNEDDTGDGENDAECIAELILLQLRGAADTRVASYTT